MNSIDSTYASVQEIRQLIEKQQLLENELKRLKESLIYVEKTSQEAIEEVHSRIDSLEKEIARMSLSIDNVVSSVERVQKTINNVYKSVGKIDDKQDKTIEVQQQFIGQLWKAFFAVLTVVTAGAGIVFALIK